MIEPSPARLAEWRRLALVVLAVVAVTAAFIAVLDPITLRSNARLIVLALAVLGVNLATGQTGLVSLGHGAFVGTGAFATAYFLDEVGLPFVLAVPAAALTAAAFGAVVGLPALRLTGIQLALVTLGVAVAFPVVARQFPKVTGGVSGRPVRSVLDPPGWAPPGLDEPIAFRFAISVVVCLIGFWLAYNLTHSRVGRAMRAVRDDPTAAVASGIDLTSIRVGAFAFSAALAGLAGALQAILFPFVSHDQFDVFLSLRLYAAAVVGGLVSIFGAIAGVIALVVIPAANDAVGLLDNDTLVFGLGLILLTFLAPDGIVGLYRRGRRRWVARREGEAESEGSEDDGAPDEPTLRPTAAARRLRRS